LEKITATGKKKILIVDNKALVGECLKAYLEPCLCGTISRNKFEFEVVETVAEAEAAIFTGLDSLVAIISTGIIAGTDDNLDVCDLATIARSAGYKGLFYCLSGGKKDDYFPGEKAEALKLSGFFSTASDPMSRIVNIIWSGIVQDYLANPDLS